MLVVESLDDIFSGQGGCLPDIDDRVELIDALLSREEVFEIGGSFIDIALTECEVVFGGVEA